MTAEDRQRALDAVKMCKSVRSDDETHVSIKGLTPTEYDTIIALLSEPAIPKWMPIEEYTEIFGKMVLLAMPNGKVTYGSLMTGKKNGWYGWDGSPLKQNPTHWMPLPAAPDKEIE